MFNNKLSYYNTKFCRYKKRYNYQDRKSRWNTIKLDANKRFIKCFSKPTDISIVEIIKEDILKKKYHFYGMI